MKLAIFGAAGFAGKIVTAKALEQGHEVKALVRTPEKLGELMRKVTLVQGDLFDSDSIRETIRDVDAVLSCAGPQRNAQYRPEQYEQAMRDMVAAMKDSGVERIVTLGGAGTVRVEGEAVEFSRKLMLFVFGMISPRIVKAKQLEYEVLRRSGLAWTMIRPPMIAKDESSGGINASADQSVGHKVAVNDLADFMLAQLNATDWVGASPIVASVYE